jgi:hypothetical protein
MLSSIAADTIYDLLTTNAVKHVNKLIPRKEDPVKQRKRRIPMKCKEAFEEELRNMFFSGKIRLSQSPWSSPVNLVKKKDGTLRTTVDYTELNARPVKDAYPIPLIEPIIDQLTDARLFTVLDLFSGNYQIELDEASRSLTAFACENRFFEFNVRSMGRCN